MDNSLQTESSTADGQGQGQQSKLDALRELQEENRRLMSNNEALIADIMREQDCEVERFMRENAALSAENYSLIEEQELNRRKAENKVFRRQKEDLLDRLIWLEKQLGAYRPMLNQINTLRKPCPNLPAEILHQIFERTIPPHFLTDSSAAFYPNSFQSQVQRQKYSIINVCRVWYSVGLPFLYKDVVLHHVSQVSTLLRTLEYSSDRNLKEMIKTVEVNCFVPKRYMQKFEQQLSLLLKSCLQIISFTLGHCIPSSLTTPLAVSQPHITHLLLDREFDAGTLECILKAASAHLISLHFHTPSGISKLGPTTLPLLRTLSVMTVWGRDSPWFDKFIDVCKMPSLTSALFSSSSALESVTRFITVFGFELRFLQCASQDRYMRETNFRTILDSCRLLEHVALSPELAGLVTHRKIKWIDIYVPPNAETGEMQELRRTISSRGGLPVLRGIRLLPWDWQESPHPIPLLLPPNLVSTATDTFTIQFLELGIQHDVAEIRLLQPNWTRDADGTDPHEHTSDESDYDSDADSASFIPDAEFERDDSSSSFDSEPEPELGITRDEDAEMDRLEFDFPWPP